MKKIVSMILCVVLVLSMFSFVSAEEKKAQIVVLKFDDVTKDNIAGFQKVIDTCKDLGVACSVGVIGQRIEDAEQSVYDTIRNWSETGTEVWHHGYYHTKAEYWTESYESQLDSFKKTYDLLKEKCGITVTSFGSPHNSSEDVTQKMFVDHFPGINAVLYEKDYNQGLDAVYFTSKLKIESGTGVVDTYDNLVEKYHSLKNADYMICQGHPAGWSDESYESFIKLVNLMKADGCIFMTPSEYVAYVENNRPKVKINGEEITAEVSARISGEEILVPFRAVLEKLYATVSYDEATDSVQAELNGKKISIANQSKIATVNGEEITSGAKAVILNGRMLIPLSLISKMLGIECKLDETLNEVNINFTKNPPVIILKCDDYKANDMSYIENFDKFYNMINEEGVTACFGLMANSSATAKAANKPIFWENTKKYIENGIEIWSHGWLHKKDANNVAEFDGYIEPETAKVNFGKALDFMKENTGYEITTFGPPFNRMNQTTADFIQSDYPQIKVVFFSDETYNDNVTVLNDRCDFESAYTFEAFAEKYEKQKYRDYLVIQMHVGKYTDEQREEVRKVIKYLKEQNCQFMTPSQYVEYAKSDNFGL